MIAGQMAFPVADGELAIGKAHNHAGGGNGDKRGHTPLLYQADQYLDPDCG